MIVKESIKLSRRKFVGGLSLAAASFSIVPGHVLGLRGATSPNEKLNIAGVGIGGQGSSDLNNMKSENIVALCDVDWDHAAHTFNDFPNAKRYKDYRKMLEEQKDIDAVVVATPDHWHAFVSMAAIQLGKHVYCEKPLTHCVWEARQLAAAAREKKVVTQMGNQGQASEQTRRLCETVAANVIGGVKEVHIWTDRPNQGLLGEYWPQGVKRPTDTPPVPANMDWDLWIGPAPTRPYNPAYAPFKWRGWWDFGTGALGDIGCHSFDPVFRALNLGQPLQVEGTSTRVNNETSPLGSRVQYKFPARGNMPPLTFTWHDGGLRPTRPDGLPDGAKMGDNGRLLIGDKGLILDDKVYLYSKEPCPEIAKTLARSPGHYLEWILACKGAGPKPGSNFDWAGPLAEVVLLGNITLRPELRNELCLASLCWDPVKMEFPNLPEANEFIRGKYREGWKL